MRRPGAESGWCWAGQHHRGSAGLQASAGALGCLLQPGCWVMGSSWPPPTMPLQLFDFIAQCVQQFLAGISSPQHRLPLGFVFPFSCRQTQLDKVNGTAPSRGCSCLLPCTSVVGSGASPVPEANGLATCSPQAELISWSKGFSCSDVEGKDVVQLLQSAIKKQEVGGCEVGVSGWGLPRGAADDAHALSLASSTTWMSLL